jgi:16S rRNA (cytosine967-C5)-methyltransferase
MPSKPASTAVAISPARACAFTVVRRVFEQGAYADRALQAEARDLDARDRALAMRLAYGAIQRLGTLDHFIALLASRPVERLDAPVLAALRLGLYELLYLAGAPDRAVVAEAVQLAKAVSLGGHGLVNAVLRRAAREGPAALLGRLSEDTPEQAAVMHSHPEWVARMWWQELGPEHARAAMAADNEPGELALRVNTLRADPDALACELAAPRPADPPLAREPVAPRRADRPIADALGHETPVALHRDPLIPEALVLDGPFDVHGSAAWRAGQVLAQSRAAMLVSRVLDPKPQERVLDLCAAPGGKSTHLAALMGGEGEVVAVERNPRRAAALRETARRVGADNVRVEVGDAARERPEGAAFDRVLVDPPCSGLGTLQARADLRWRVTPQQVTELAGVQAAILGAGARSLRPGGVLVYSTCTISPAENERVIEGFLRENPDFALDDFAAELPVYAHPRAQRCLLTLPHRDRTAGFFIARLCRRAVGAGAR